MSEWDSTKQCRKCGLVWPLDEKHFRRDPKACALYNNVCKVCISPKERQALMYARLTCKVGFKVCGKCVEPKPATTEHFARDGSSPDGLERSCKACLSAYRRKREAADPGMAKARRKRWVDANPDYKERYYRENTELVRARERAYYKANKEAVLARCKDWYERNRERVAQTSKEYRKRNPGKVAMWSRNQRALKRAAEGSHDLETVWRMYEDQQGLCAYCETPLDGGYHVDHMEPVSRGGSNDWSNLAVTCPQCNLRKSDKTVEEFMEQLNPRSVA